MKLCILYGGTSKEREVSLNSGKSIINAISSEYELLEYDFNGNFDLLYSNIYDTDLVFNALHGGIGENGMLQKFLESKKVLITAPYSFFRTCSALGVDTSANKLIFQ